VRSTTASSRGGQPRNSRPPRPRPTRSSRPPQQYAPPPQQYAQPPQQYAPPPPAPAPAAAPSVDLVAELSKLADLKASGVLSDAEFEAAKAKLIAG